MVEKPRATDNEDDDKPANPDGEEGETAPIPQTRIQRWMDRAKLAYEKADRYIWDREPHLWPTLFTALGVTLLLSLGFWQLHRLEWKNSMLRDINAALSAPITDMRSNFPRSDSEWKKYNYHPIIIKGTWLSVHGFKMIPRTYEDQVGYHLILPLKLPDNQIIFVNRGFVPDNGAILPQPEEKVFAVQGVLRKPEALKNWATPDNDPSKGVWTWTDLAAMRHEIGVNSTVPMILYQAREEAQDSYPIGGQLPVPESNRHKQYALTWFALAIAFMVIWMIASSPKEKIKPVDETAAANDDERMKDPVARRGLYPEATD